MVGFYLFFYTLGGIAEMGFLFFGVTAHTYEEGAYWISFATYVAVVAVAMRQILNGQSISNYIQRAVANLSHQESE